MPRTRNRPQPKGLLDFFGDWKDWRQGNEDQLGGLLTAMMSGDMSEDTINEALGYSNLGGILSVKGFKVKPDFPLLENVLNNPSYHAKNKNLAARQVWLTPDEYIDRAAGGFKSIDPSSSKARMLSTRNKDGLVEQYSAAMKNGDLFPTAYLDYSGGYNNKPTFRQEGLHRALAAKQAGVERMPVYILDDAIPNQPSMPKHIAERRSMSAKELAEQEAFEQSLLEQAEDEMIARGILDNSLPSDGMDILQRLLKDFE